MIWNEKSFAFTGTGGGMKEGKNIWVRRASKSTLLPQPRCGDCNSSISTTEAKELSAGYSELGKPFRLRR